ncbi:tRNA 2-methylthioadenosine synthase [Giardia lamblia P15]|uniref:Threonylcarbamoyladenosine tRNA methylthiotransferase n=1 Tax=Giardia intestinalis (strain P15) TaxID=658858 RepID=E1EYY2_GIAIA|nr:tRNA 2-methylthioadenosine synthase [Giardia lamblia P15]
MDIEDQVAPTFAPAQSASLLLTNVRVMMVTMGCGHNAAESDIIASALQTAGAVIIHSNGKYITPESAKDVDVLYINSCTVKNPSEDKAFVHVQKGLEVGTVVVLGGCVPQSYGAMSDELRKASASKQLIISGVLTQQWLTALPGLLREAIDFHILNTSHVLQPALRMTQPSSKAGVSAAISYVTKEATKDVDVEYLKCTPVHRANPIIDIISTGSGCMGSCTYCKTCHSRGRLRSVPLDTLLTRIRNSLADPVIRELWLTGEDTLAWGRESGTTFAGLLQEVQKLLETENPTHKMLKIGMTDPDSIINQEDSLASFICCKYVYKFLHLPVQSGSDRILTLMRRHYDIETFLKSCSKLQSAVPDLCLDTDIICGFPGETDEDHAQSLNLFRNLKEDAPRFQVVNITQYYARKNTPAASMEQVPASKKRERTKEMSEVVKNSFRRDQYHGQVHDIMVLEKLQTESHGRQYGGKTYNNLTVVIETVDQEVPIKLGSYIRVRITGSTRVALIGSVMACHSSPVVVRRVK